MPYAIAAKFAHPDRPVIALVGDGAFQMNGMNEMLTIAKYRQRWPDQRLIVLVLHNNDLNQVTWEQRAMEGDPKFEASQDLPDFDYAAYAELGRAARDPGRRSGRRSAPPGTRRSPPTGRSCSTRVTDPEVPPLPPHITLRAGGQLRRVGRPRRPGPRRA